MGGAQAPRPGLPRQRHSHVRGARTGGAVLPLGKAGLLEHARNRSACARGRRDPPRGPPRPTGRGVGAQDVARRSRRGPDRPHRPQRHALPGRRAHAAPVRAAATAPPRRPRRTEQGARPA